MKAITLSIGRIVMTLWWGMWAAIAFGFILGMWLAWFDKLPIHTASGDTTILKVACLSMPSACGTWNDQEQSSEDQRLRRTQTATATGKRLQRSVHVENSAELKCSPIHLLGRFKFFTAMC